MISSSLRLEPVNAENFDAVCAVQVRPDQGHLVSPVMKSLAEAYVHGDVAWPRAIVDGDEVVGFVMAFLDIVWDPAKDPTGRRSGIWRLNISAGFYRARATAASRSTPSSRRSAAAASARRTSAGTPARAAPSPSTWAWASAPPANSAVTSRSAS